MLEENASDGDLNFTNGSLVVIDDRATETGQRMVSRLKTVKGEWFLNILFGLDYRNVIWPKQVSTQARDAHIQTQALLSAGKAAKILKYKTTEDTANRSLSVEMDIQDADVIIDNISIGL